MHECARACRPRCVEVPLGVFHRSIIPAPLAPAALPSPRPHGLRKARSTSMPPQLHAPRCSVHQCVLDQEKTESSGGTLVPGAPSPHPLCCVTRMGLSLLPLPQYAVSPGASGSERGPRRGPRGEPWLHTPPGPTRRARVGVAVMASVDIL